MRGHSDSPGRTPRREIIRLNQNRFECAVHAIRDHMDCIGDVRKLCDLPDLGVELRGHINQPKSTKIGKMKRNEGSQKYLDCLAASLNPRERTYHRVSLQL